MRSVFGVFVVAGLLMGVGRAAEHITLRNGFELNCDHRGLSDADAASAAGQVRLYLDASDANYIDVAPAEIVSVEALPSPPAAALPPSLSAAKPAAAKADLTAAELRQILADAGAEHDLDVDLLASVVHAESGSHARAVSRTGAQGLMQLMPATAAELGVKDSFAPEQNVHGGTAYLDSLLKRYHDNLALALAAYNAGPGAVDRYHGIPPYRETRAYVARIIHEFNQRYAARQAASGLAMAR
jgi:soluble lytic murein transglycosylase-like protein